MPYSKTHKKATRDNILSHAIQLFSSAGYDQVSIDQLMQKAGLTRGAFYAHFKNKKEVYSEAIMMGARNSRIMAKKPADQTNDAWIEDLLFSYLSEAHVNQEISPCPLAFLVTDVGNNESEVKETYTRIYNC